MKFIPSFLRVIVQNLKYLSVFFIFLTAFMLVGSAVSHGFDGHFDYTLPTVGTIKTIGVTACWDPDLQNEVETIDWGTIYVGLTKNVTLYIRNVSNVNTQLHLNSLSVTPAGISTYMSVYWDYDERILNPDEVLQINLFLSLSDSHSFSNYLLTEKVNNFSFDILIIAA